MNIDPQTSDADGRLVLEKSLAMDGGKREQPPSGEGSGEPANVASLQLSFPFAGTPEASQLPLRDLAPLPAASRSRRALRAAAPGRQVRAESIERPTEEVRLEQALLAYLPTGKTINVRLTDNRYTMVMVRRAPEGYSVRLHRMFSGADGKLVRAIARYVVYNDARASATIGAFIDKNQHVIRRQPRRPRRVVMRTEGRCHDLRVIFERLNQRHFDGKLDAQITWGPAPRRERPRRSIKMGSFAVEDRIIRIHPVLDHHSVPEYFVAWIVFHEMLHGKYEVVRRGGRRCFHSKAFLAEERTFPDYDRACAWERANIDRLLGG